MKVIGKGSITKLEKKPKSKCRKWRLRVQTTDGEKTKRISGTWTEAEDALKDFVSELEMKKCDHKFSDYAETWTTRRELSGDIAGSTLRKNRQHLRVLNAQFGEIMLAEMDKPTAEDGLLSIKHKDGKVLSGTYMQQLYATMKAIFQSAVDDDLIPKNPLAKIKPPKKDTAKRAALSRETLGRFLSALDNIPLDSHTVGLHIAVLAGLRRGEIIALQWGDIDSGVIRVRRSMEEHNMHIKEPKSVSGIRDVPMIEELEATLARWKGIQRAKFDVLGIEQMGSTPIMSSDTGSYIFPQNFDRWWRKVRPSFGLDGVVIHELRHTYLTMLASGGAPSQVIKSLAGWSSISMADTYVHDDEEANREASRNLGRMIRVEIARANDVPNDVPTDVPKSDIDKRKQA